MLHFINLQNLEMDYMMNLPMMINSKQIHYYW